MDRSLITHEPVGLRGTVRDTKTLQLLVIP